MDSEATHYETLQVRDDASIEAIRGAYRYLSQAHHPDRGGDPALAARINVAYEVLSDPARRAAYDRDLAAARAQAWKAPESPAEPEPRDVVRPETSDEPVDARIPTSRWRMGWYKTLLGASAAMLFLGLPYAVMTVGFSLNTVAGGLFWLGAGFYARSELASRCVVERAR